MYFKELNLFMRHKQVFLYFLIITNSLTLLYQNKGSTSKNKNLREYQSVHLKYIFFSIKFCTREKCPFVSYMMVCVQTAKGWQEYYKKPDTLLSQKSSGHAKVLLSPLK